jgi:excisionase family DNA binding protein
MNEEKMNEHAIIEKLDEIKHIVKSKVTDRWLNMGEVCDYCGLSDSTIRRSLRKGVLKASTSTGKLLFKISDVDRWLNE